MIEAPYVDRHFIEEYTGYYANTLRPPPQKTVRLHFFSTVVDESRFRGWLRRVQSEGAETVQREIEAEYLGFSVIRPLAFAPIGRTVLRTYGARESRCFEPARTGHRVHLAGLELLLEGLPFQQQDQAVGACATTAIWSALARVMRADGNRPTTPLAITTAATRHLLSARPFPAVAGLDLNQMLAAIRAFGYSPDVTKGATAAHYQMLLKCYVASGIPVILTLRQEETGEVHAVSVVGYRESDDEEEAQPISIGEHGGKQLNATGITRLYAHDDRLGPYARMSWLKSDEDGTPRLRFTPGASGFERFEEPLHVWYAIAPLYPKLRLAADDLMSIASQLLPTVLVLAGKPDWREVWTDLRFQLSGAYLRQALELPVSSQRKEALVMSAKLSRYVGVIRFWKQNEWFADVICDTTDIRRPTSDYSPVLAIVPHDEKVADTLRKYLAQAGHAAAVF